MNKKLYDVVIAGAGPAGAGTALHLARMGYHVAVVDKAGFPRDKVCGDGLTSHILFEMNELGLLDEFLQLPQKNIIRGVRFYAPSRQHVDFRNCFRNHFNHDFCYIFKRKDFDNFLLEKLKQDTNIIFRERFRVTDIGLAAENVYLANGTEKIYGKVLVGADGAGSLTARKLLNFRHNWKHTFLTMQCYYKNLQPIYDNDVMEAYSMHNFIPGYIWIFPGVENTYNIGLGVNAGIAQKKKLNIKKFFRQVLEEHPLFTQRLKGAERISPLRGGIIPFSKGKRKISGKRFLLVGDAASITNPVTGEGIAYGMNTGRIAAGHLHECLQNNDFSEAAMKGYDIAVAKKFGKIMRRSYDLQKIIMHNKFINRITRNVAKNKKVKKTIEELLSDPKNYLELYNPVFYYRIFIG